METKDGENVVYCWGKLNDLLEYLISRRYSDAEKVKRAKDVAFDICIKFGKSFQEERGMK